VRQPGCSLFYYVFKGRTALYINDKTARDDLVEWIVIAKAFFLEDPSQLTIETVIAASS